MIPRAAFYRNQGKELCYLNKMEYEALVDFKMKGNENSKRIIEFDFGSDFKCTAMHAQYLHAKQHTIIITRKAPPHPGKRPTQGCKNIKQWKQ